MSSLALVVVHFMIYYQIAHPRQLAQGRALSLAYT